MENELIRKEWFVPFRNPVPADMEYFLEEKASEGYTLLPLGEQGLFTFRFLEGKPTKCKYMVDVSNLPKTLYVQTLIDKGWQYLGTTGNCYVWKQEYDDVRPEDMSDSFCRKQYCKKFGLIMLALFILILTISIGLIWGYYYEIKMHVGNKHIIYIFEAIFNLPFLIYTFWAYRKLSDGVGRC